MFSFITDGQTLLLILALLYLTECLIWVKKQSIAFVSPWPALASRHADLLAG